MQKNAAPATSVTATAPCRVDLAGGTLGIWPLYLFDSGAVTVNFAVTVRTRCHISKTSGTRSKRQSLDTGSVDSSASVDELCHAQKFSHPLAANLVRFFAPEGGFTLETHSESPAGAGISGSSALMVATTAALASFTGRQLSLEEIRVIAQNVEAQLIRVPTGCQDYYPALYGGVSAIHLEADGIHRQAITVAPEEIDSRFVLAYTGAPRQSGINNWKVFQAHINEDKKVFRNFEQIAAIARALHEALSNADWDEVAKLLRAEWKLRKTNAPRITTPLIEKLIKVATKNGAKAAKVCGAGGGGCVVFLTEPDTKQRVAASIREAGATVLAAKVAREGLALSGSHALPQLASN